MLAACATGDGNLLLNFSPNALGEIPSDQADLLREMGKWMEKNGESIYKTNGGPFNNGELGGSTYGGITVFLHVFEWKGGCLILPPLKANIVKCTVDFKQTANNIVLTLPAGKQDKINTVVIMELNSPAVNEMKNGHRLVVEK